MDKKAATMDKKVASTSAALIQNRPLSTKHRPLSTVPVSKSQTLLTSSGWSSSIVISNSSVSIYAIIRSSSNLTKLQSPTVFLSFHLIKTLDSTQHELKILIIDPFLQSNLWYFGYSISEYSSDH